jgi:cytochrome c oxidase assembly factor CtaG
VEERATRRHKGETTCEFYPPFSHPELALCQEKRGKIALAVSRGPKKYRFLALWERWLRDDRRRHPWYRRKKAFEDSSFSPEWPIR